MTSPRSPHRLSGRAASPACIAQQVSTATARLWNNRPLVYICTRIVPVASAPLGSEHFIRGTRCLPDQHRFGMQSLFSLILWGSPCVGQNHSHTSWSAPLLPAMHGCSAWPQVVCTCGGGAALMHRGCGGRCASSAAEAVGNAVWLHCPSLLAGSHLKAKLRQHHKTLVITRSAIKTSKHSISHTSQVCRQGQKIMCQ